MKIYQPKVNQLDRGLELSVILLAGATSRQLCRFNFDMHRAVVVVDLFVGGMVK